LFTKQLFTIVHNCSQFFTIVHNCCQPLLQARAADALLEAQTEAGEMSAQLYQSRMERGGELEQVKAESEQRVQVRATYPFIPPYRPARVLNFFCGLTGVLFCVLCLFFFCLRGLSVQAMRGAVEEACRAQQLAAASEAEQHAELVAVREAAAHGAMQVRVSYRIASWGSLVFIAPLCQGHPLRSTH
jgi:hypothetical protein